MKRISYYLLFLTVLLAFAGCSKKNNSNPVSTAASDPAPDFNLTAKPVTLNTGDAGLSFYARCTTNDIDLIKVVVENPRGQQVTFNANNNLFVKNEEFQCQDDGTGYFKYLGTWQLTFVGNKASGSKSSFSVNKSMSVTGKVSVH